MKVSGSEYIDFLDSYHEEKNDYNEVTGRNVDYCTMTDEMLEEE